MGSDLQQLAKAPRLRWTLGLHQKFLAACNELGGPLTATPKNILTRMDEQGEHGKAAVLGTALLLPRQGICTACRYMCGSMCCCTGW